MLVLWNSTTRNDCAPGLMSKLTTKIGKKKWLVSHPHCLMFVLSCTVVCKAKINSCWNMGGWTSSSQTNSENLGGTICKMAV